jgi:hypothetical protein
MMPARVLVILLFLVCLGTAQETTTYIGHYLEPFPGPQVYKDPNTERCSTWKQTDGMWLQSRTKENSCGLKTPSKTRICRFTGRKSRRLFSSVRPQGRSPTRRGVKQVRLNRVQFVPVWVAEDEQRRLRVPWPRLEPHLLTVETSPLHFLSRLANFHFTKSVVS